MTAWARLVVVAVTLLLAGTVRPARAGDARPGSPRLVVIVVIDQLRADLLTRFEDLFVEGGFKRLTTGGAWFTQCHYEHGVTMTGPGHACIATGANPAVHGIVGNVWLEQAGERLENVRCSSHPYASGGFSAERMQADTLGDRLKQIASDARVLSCSLKDTAANMMAGRQADGCYWLDLAGGGLRSRGDLPQWVQSFLEQGGVSRYAGNTWARLVDAAQYDRRCRRDDADYERGRRWKLDNTFPHRLPRKPMADYCRALFASPFGNDVVLEFSRRALKELRLGQRGPTDLLMISLSSNDVVGHAFGPHSHEIMDITLRTDRQLAAFFETLDQQVGLQHCVIALTGDHGVCNIPEYAVECGRPGGRLETSAFQKRLEKRLRKACGAPRGADSFVAGVRYPWLYFEPAALPAASASTLRATVEEVIAAEPGIARVLWLDPRLRGAGSADEPADLRRCIDLSIYPGRSGHAYLHLSENWFDERNATGHGTAHAYDTHVPLLLFGAQVKPGRYHNRVSPTDIAPTLARLMGIPAPSKATGRVLHEALGK